MILLNSRKGVKVQKLCLIYCHWLYKKNIKRITVLYVKKSFQWLLRNLSKQGYSKKMEKTIKPNLDDPSLLTLVYLYKLFNKLIKALKDLRPLGQILVYLSPSN